MCLFSQSDVLYAVAPCFHIYGFLLQIICMLEGARIVTDARFDLIRMLQTIKKEKVCCYYVLLVYPRPIQNIKALYI